MKRNKGVFLTAIVSIFAMNVSAVAQVTPASQSAEALLLESTLSLQGQSLSKADLQKQLVDDLKTYDQTAPQEGRDQRLVQAMVDMNLYTPAQAQSLFTDAVTAQSNVLSATKPDQMMVSELSRLTNNHPGGAEFSACTAADVTIGAVMIGSIGAALYGLFTAESSAVCPGGLVLKSSGPYANVYGCAGTSDGGYIHPNAPRSKQLYIGGAIGLAVSVIAIVGTEMAGCN